LNGPLCFGFASTSKTLGAALIAEGCRLAPDSSCCFGPWDCPSGSDSQLRFFVHTPPFKNFLPRLRPVIEASHATGPWKDAVPENSFLFSWGIDCNHGTQRFSRLLVVPVLFELTFSYRLCRVWAPIGHSFKLGWPKFGPGVSQ